MVKTSNGTLRFLITTAVLVAAAGVAWGLLSGTVDTMNEDGCKPAQQHKTDIAVIELHLRTIQDDVVEMKTAQTSMHKEVMQAIKESE